MSDNSQESVDSILQNKDDFRFSSATNTSTQSNDEIELDKIKAAKQTTTYYKLNFVNTLFELIRNLITNKNNQKQKLADYRIKENINKLNTDSFKLASEVRSLRSKLENKTDDLMKNINSLKLMTVSRLNTELNTYQKLRDEMLGFEYQQDYTENITISPDYNDEDPLVNNTIKTKYRVFDMPTTLPGYELNSSWNILKFEDEKLGNISVLTNSSNIHNIR